ncbi:ATP phosphoribosyltransferase [Candidatus Bathyarchaeota archaeon]|nr:MAG: ATP phosphoribosyltransferase [Candidatus Bathyarchaeota archaeon]
MILALPNKGRLHEPALDLLEKAGIRVIDRGMLYGRTNDPEINVIFARAADIPSLVEAGAADLGVTGHDYVVEADADVEELLDLEFGRAELVLAVMRNSGIEDLSDLKPGLRVATKYVNIASNFFRRLGLEAEVIRITGAAEVMPHLKVADAIIDISSTGTTLKTHGLKPLKVILKSSARLIANRKSLEVKRDKLMEIKLAIESVLRGKGKKLLMMNVPDRFLKDVLSVLPAMAGPTIAEVKSEERMWEVYTVIDEDEVYRVVNLVKKAGAKDLLVIPIERVIP